MACARHNPVLLLLQWNKKLCMPSIFKASFSPLLGPLFKNGMWVDSITAFFIWIQVILVWNTEKKLTATQYSQVVSTRFVQYQVQQGPTFTQGQLSFLWYSWWYIWQLNDGKWTENETEKNGKRSRGSSSVTTEWQRELLYINYDPIGMQTFFIKEQNGHHGHYMDSQLDYVRDWWRSKIIKRFGDVFRSDDYKIS